LTRRSIWETMNAGLELVSMANTAQFHFLSAPMRGQLCELNKTPNFFESRNDVHCMRKGSPLHASINATINSGLVNATSKRTKYLSCQSLLSGEIGCVSISVVKLLSRVCKLSVDSSYSLGYGIECFGSEPLPHRRKIFYPLPL